MAGARYRFGPFVLDCEQRTLHEVGHEPGDERQRPVTLNPRYFDALVLLVENAGGLISKDRFNDDVWRSVPVTDEALTQCIRSLRSALGDKARNPRFIETVPKHGYRFVGEVSQVYGSDPSPGAGSPALGPSPAGTSPKAASWMLVHAGMGGGGAGLIGGTIYGLIGLPEAPSALSTLLILLVLCGGVGLMAGLGVGAGLALAARIAPPQPLSLIAGGAAGGVLIGALAKMIGLDAFALLFGRAPAAMTGAPEGLLLGTVVGLLVWLARVTSARRGATLPIALAVPAGIMAGALIAFSGGRLMAGSLAGLAAQFTESRIRLDRIGALFGDAQFGPLSLAFTTAFEAMLFVTCVVAGILFFPRSTGAHEPVHL